MMFNEKVSLAFAGMRKKVKVRSCHYHKRLNNELLTSTFRILLYFPSLW